jgi:thymidylate kinase
VVEGCNGVGKSTVAEYLCRRLGAAHYHYPPEFYRFRQDIGLDVAIAPVPRLVYYLGATLHLADLVRAQLAQRSVICDRYLPSPLSLLIAEAALGEEEVCRIAQPFEPYLIAPDVILLLTSDHAVAGARIRDRLGDRPTVTSTERMVLESAEFFERREAAIRRQALRLAPVVELNTTELSVGDVCRRAWDLVGARGKALAT